VDEMAKKVAAYDPAAVRSAKEAVVRGMDMSLAEGLELERLLASRLRAKEV
jgi:enoyl-CoA hydratase/carnithine racemase